MGAPWLLTDADNVGGASAWVNTIPNGSPTSPPPSVPSGAYDSVSKRLMALPDSTDLWVLATRNGVDFSGANSPTPTQLGQMVRAGIQYAVGEISRQTSANSASVAELQAFQNAGLGFQTAAYCFLGLDKTAAPGDQQVAAGVAAMGGVGSATFNALGFIAIDVEEESLLADPAPLSKRLTIIAQALQQIYGSGKRVVIYTNKKAWNKVTNGAICSLVSGQVVCTAGSPGQVQAFPLWEFTSYNSFYDSSGKPHCGDGVPSLTPFTPFDGWGATPGSPGALGKQYDIGVRGKTCAGFTYLSGIKVQVDRDVFDPSLFQ